MTTTTTIFSFSSNNRNEQLHEEKHKDECNNESGKCPRDVVIMLSFNDGSSVTQTISLKSKLETVAVIEAIHILEKTVKNRHVFDLMLSILAD